MRLSIEEKQAILDSLYEVDKNAEVYLYGSRANDFQKGGDIDLIIISDKMGYSEKLDFKFNLFNRIEEQKVDIIISKREEIEKKIFLSHVFKNALKLSYD